MRAVVTGGCGFIGSHIVDELVKLGHDVIVIDDLSAPQNEEFFYNSKAAYHHFDVSKDDCGRLFCGADVVFHLAARRPKQPPLDSPGECFEVNVIGTQRVLEWAKQNHIKKVIYSSTSSLYGRDNEIPFRPNMTTGCLNPYSLSKWMGELTCKLYTQLYAVDTIVLRYFNVYGPREPLKGSYAPVIGLFKRQYKSGQPMSVVGDGEQRRDFTYIADVVDANILAMDGRQEGHSVYNIGTGYNYSINQIAEMIGGIDATTTKIPERPAEARETLADVTKTIRELGWKPKHRLEDRILQY